MNMRTRENPINYTTCTYRYDNIHASVTLVNLFTKINFALHSLNSNPPPPQVKCHAKKITLILSLMITNFIKCIAKMNKTLLNSICQSQFRINENMYNVFHYGKSLCVINVVYEGREQQKVWGIYIHNCYPTISTGLGIYTGRGNECRCAHGTLF